MKLLKTLNEMHGRTIGYYDEHSRSRSKDTYDRAREMINAAVVEADDAFEMIADVNDLVEFLHGRYHDFSPEIEAAVRDIIATETGMEEEEESNPTNPSWATRIANEFEAAMNSMGANALDPDFIAAAGEQLMDEVHEILRDRGVLG